MRIGHGYDVHRLVSDRKLIIGGVNILYDRGLLGHSDADVLVHAVMDALLGAAGLGDIGMMFPDDDPEYEGADSIGLLKRVTSRIEDISYKISNIDCTVIAQKPKLSPYTDEMADKIAKACNIERSRVNVKATTEERLGFTGSELGIAAHAVALLEE